MLDFLSLAVFRLPASQQLANSFFTMNLFRHHKLAVILLAGICGGLDGFTKAKGEVIAYPAPRGIDASADYQVRADGKNIFVYKTPVFSMATFSF
ncbi:MAG: hypothetical protein WCJ07_11590, partial [Verrucomicrobiota bacterium]